MTDLSKDTAPAKTDCVGPRYTTWRQRLAAVGAVLVWTALVFFSVRAFPSAGDLTHHRLDHPTHFDLLSVFVTTLVTSCYLMAPFYIWCCGLAVLFNAVPYLRGHRTLANLTMHLTVLVVGLVFSGWIAIARDRLTPIVALTLMIGASAAVGALIQSYRAWVAFEDSGLIPHSFRELDGDHSVVQVLEPGTATSAMVRTHGEVDSWLLSYETLAASQEVTPDTSLAAGANTVLLDRARRNARPTWDELVDSIAARITELQTAAATVTCRSPAPDSIRGALLELDRCESLLRPFAQRAAAPADSSSVVSWDQWSSQLTASVDGWQQELTHTPLTRDDLTYTQGQTLQTLRTVIARIYR